LLHRKNVVMLFQFATRLPAIHNALAAYAGDHVQLVRDEFTQPLQKSIGDLQRFCEMVEKSVDLDALKRNEYLISADFNARLGELRNDKERLVEEVSGAKQLRSGFFTLFLLYFCLRPISHRLYSASDARLARVCARQVSSGRRQAVDGEAVRPPLPRVAQRREAPA
jgi:hypothetical protein